jgi:protein SCO1/2
MNRSAAIVIGCAALVLAAVVALRVARQPRTLSVPPALVGVLRAMPQPLPELRLHDQSGAAFSREQLAGRWTLLFFGYTSCPDICPTTMATLAQLTAELRRRGEPPPQVVLVSVDPVRDTPERLAAYVAHFDPMFLGASGDDAALGVLAQAVGAMYQRDPPDPDGGYQVAHSASIFLVDPQARAVAAFPPPHQPVALADQLETIRALLGHR